MLDQMTLADLARIAEAFKGGAATQPASPYSRYIGKRCIVRSNQAGVYVGVVAEAHPDGVTLEAGARQLHYWSAGGSCLQIAESGIKQTGSRVTAPSSSPLVVAAGAQFVAAHQMTDEAWKTVQSCPIWTGGISE